ncbi:UNVERIFIED_CONTAM: hypothetical protein Sindi_1968600, partial [Sesamum indicum]
MIEEYLKQMENDLKKNLSGIASPMETSSKKNGENKFSCLAGEAQNPFEEFLKKNSLTIFLKESGRHLKENQKWTFQNHLKTKKITSSRDQSRKE